METAGSAIKFNREAVKYAKNKETVFGKSPTNGSKLSATQRSIEAVEKEVINVIDYRILRKSGGLKV